MHEPASVYKPFDRDALIHAARCGDTVEIDAITDRLVQQGLCRPRTDESRSIEWAAMRRKPIQPESAVTVGDIHIEASATSAVDIGKLIAEQMRGMFAGAK
jgi:hypothetical protein